MCNTLTTQLCTKFSFISFWINFFVKEILENFFQNFNVCIFWAEIENHFTPSRDNKVNQV